MLRIHFASLLLVLYTRYFGYNATAIRAGCNVGLGYVISSSRIDCNVVSIQLVIRRALAFFCFYKLHEAWLSRRVDGYTYSRAYEMAYGQFPSVVQSSSVQ